MGPHSQYLQSQMVRPAQFYLSVWALVTDLVSFLKTGIQIKDLTSAIVEATPPYKFIFYLMLSLVVSILGKRSVFGSYPHKYLHSLTVDLAVFYSLQISDCILPFFVHDNYKISLEIVFRKLLEPLFS